ncbi:MULTISPECIES: Myb-like DNA-binding domain-containing protein [Psychrobacter]|uniref:Myb-like DNA-binding domain-containing protein n=1 Tax=Psychrobacter TaxID=497 RepID=UPI0019194368|nr:MULTISPECIES: Myb-like DNA-binding domain-containing protein [Psychrobacter]
MDTIDKDTTNTQRLALMNNQEAINIIQALIDGINPLSDEPLANSSLCLNSDIQRALQATIPALESRIRYDERKAKLPANAGLPWTDEEDQQLIAAFDEGNSIANLVEQHQRTKGSITSRLLKFGKIVG